MIKAVLFDFDGTLINTNELIFDSYKYAFKTVLNREIGMAEMLSMYGRPLKAALMKYGEVADELIRVYREFNETRHDMLAKPFDGACEGVSALRRGGFKLGIVTSKRRELLMRGLRIMGLENSFDVLITPEDTEKSKPDPEPISIACEKLGIEPHEAIYIGDSEFDLAAGNAAGTMICAVNYSVTPKTRLADFSPDFYIDSIDELCGVLEGVNNGGKA